MAFLALDTETFGIGNVTLLTAWFGVYDKDFNLKAELDLKLKPDDGLYIGQPKALGINKIDLYEHDKIAITYKQGATELYNFLRANTKLGGEQLIPCGHNISFDIRKITDNLVSKGSWDTMVSYRTLDTGTISQFLRMTGKLPMEVEAGLGKLVKHFDIKVDGEMHTAETDAKCTIKVLQKLMELVKCS